MRMQRTLISLLTVGAVGASGGVALATSSKQPAKQARGGLRTGNVSLKVLAPTPNQVITGQDLALRVRVTGYKLDAYYAGTPNLAYIGHYHEILDGKLIDMTPLQGPTRDTISTVGVTPGRHVLTIVPARNNHSMVMSKAVKVRFTYNGPYGPQPAGYTGTGTPGISIISPAPGSTVRGSSFDMTARVSNFVLSQESFGKSLVTGEGHWHIFLDKVGMAHMLTMAGGDTQTVPLKGVKPGKHTFYAVLVNNQHMPTMPMVMTSVKLLVK
jgi:hypothetical protein